MTEQKLMTEMNRQIQEELASEYIYLGMAAYFASENLPGFSSFFKIQAAEEKEHGMKFFDFLDEIGRDVELFELPQPKCSYESPVDAVKAALEHEKHITARIHFLMDLATEERYYPAVSFLNWFVEEQVEEESTFRDLLARMEMVGGRGHGMLMLDGKLGERKE